MKYIVKLTLILSLFVQLGYAQTQPTVQTVEEYRVLFNTLVNNARAAEKNAASYVGKPFSEFVAYLEKNDLTVFGVVPMESQPNRQTRQIEQIELSLSFITRENFFFARDNRLRHPTIRVFFDGDRQLFNKAWDLAARYRGDFRSEAVRGFFSDLVIREIKFNIPGRMHQRRQ